MITENLVFPAPAEFYVKLDKYTLCVTCGSLRQRIWAPFDGPILDFPSDFDSHGTCRIVLNDETHTITRVEAEQILIDRGFIDPAVDDPFYPVYPWVKLARGSAA